MPVPGPPSCSTTNDSVSTPSAATAAGSAHRPALRLKPGDRVVTKTIDAWGFDSQGKKVAERPNPQTGPFFVEGAERGDVLVVQLEKIEPNRATAWSGSLLAPYAVDPGFLRSHGLKEQQDQIWTIDKKNGIAWLESSAIHPGRIEVPLKPMLGCLAVAPDRKEAIATSTPDTFGGNLDYNGLVAGVKVMLPVFESGALLFLGDGHAAQGDGEIIGNALETSMDVEFSVDLIKGKTINWPRATKYSRSRLSGGRKGWTGSVCGCQSMAVLA